MSGKDDIAAKRYQASHHQDSDHAQESFSALQDVTPVSFLFFPFLHGEAFQARNQLLFWQKVIDSLSISWNTMKRQRDNL
jgi:hypothetical protein